MQSYENFRPLCLEIKKVLERLECNRQDVRFIWTPAHIGITGNEMADRRAKQALQLDECDITPLPIDYRDLLPKVKHSIRALFSSLWRQSDHTFLKVVKPETGEWLSSYRSSRRDEVVIARLRVGHTRLTHSGVIRSSTHDRCTSCDLPLTVVHVLLRCNIYVDARRDLRLKCARLNIPFDLRHLLGDEHPSVLEGVLSFLRQTLLINEI